ncbi:MAG: hypothetical protein ABUK01_12500 [Leptospirales bacterium]
MLRRQIKFFITVILLILVTLSVAAASKWIWRIDKKEVSVVRFEQDYNSFISMVAWQADMEPEQLKELILRAKSDQGEKGNALLNRVGRKAFASNYEDILLLHQDAVKTGYTEKEDVKAYLEFIEDYYAAQVYLMHIKSKFHPEFTEDELLEKWSKTVEENPEYEQITIDEGLKMMRSQMTKQKRVEFSKQFMKDLKKKYKFERSSDYEQQIAN